MKAVILTFFGLITICAALIWCIGSPTLASVSTLFASLLVFFVGVANIPLDL